MRKRSKGIWMSGAVGFLTWTEKRLGYLITKADQAQEKMLKKMDVSLKQRRKKNKAKKQLLERGTQQDAEASVANYIAQKQISQKIVDIRLNEIQQGDRSAIECEYEHE